MVTSCLSMGDLSLSAFKRNNETHDHREPPTSDWLLVKEIFKTSQSKIDYYQHSKTAQVATLDRYFIRFQKSVEHIISRHFYLF